MTLFQKYESELRRFGPKEMLSEKNDCYSKGCILQYLL